MSRRRSPVSALVASNEEDRRDNQGGHRIVVRSPSVRTGIQPAVVVSEATRTRHPLNVSPRAASAASDSTSSRRSVSTTPSPFAVGTTIARSIVADAAQTQVGRVVVEVPDSDSESETNSDLDLDPTDIEDDDHDESKSFSLVEFGSASITSTDTGETTPSDDEDEGLAARLGVALGLSAPPTCTLTRAATLPAVISSSQPASSSPISGVQRMTPRSTTTPIGSSTLNRTTSDNSGYVRPSPPLATARPAGSIGTEPITPSKGKASLTPSGPVLAKADNGYFVIAHDGIAQKFMDANKLPWGVQYELARGVTKGMWKWDDVFFNTREISSALIDVKKQASLVPSFISDIMLGRPQVVKRPKLWEELHREQLALLENKSRGLGLRGDWKDEPNWYGGKIQQIVKLVPREQTSSNKKEQPVFHVQLEPMEMGRSHRFARFLGSRRLLQMRVPKSYDLDLKKLKELLAQKFVLCGRVFVAFAVKDRKLHFVETDEDYEREADCREGDQHRMSLEALVRWYNPMDLNQKQKINKWTTRFDLGLSTSIPILQFKPENIEIIDDLYAPHADGPAPTNKIYTDGCGFMNASGLLAISRQLGFIERTTAVQGRILGSKGVWALHPEHMSLDEPPMIWIRKSQQKIHLVRPGGVLEGLHPAHLIFDLVAPARVWTPSRLSRGTVINFHHNGVPLETLVKRMEEGLRREIEPLTQWNVANAMPLLWNAVNKISGVTPQRIERIANGMERASGLSRRRDYGDESDGNGLEDVDGPSSSSSASLDTPPITIAEGVMDRLQAGFSPLQDGKLYGDLRRLVEETMKKAVLEYHITVPASAEAFIIPDPTGLLEPGEIHFTSTQYLKDPLVEADARTILGDVLIFRNPARVASDVQKVVAVYLPELAHYVDVIVVPVAGEESLPSMLAGGDVDGDTAVCIWDRELVDSFQQPAMVREPDDLMENFEPLGSVPTVGRVLEDMHRSDDADLMLRGHLLTGFSDSKTGLYSMFHENTIWKYGYDHSNTIRNAFMFTTILDSRKSGLVLKESVFAADRKRDGWRQPACFGGPDNDTLVQNERMVEEPFILDELRKEGGKIQRALLKQYDGLKQSFAVCDTDLAQLWDQASKVRLPQYEEEVAKVKAHVEDCVDMWNKMWKKIFANKSSETTKNEKKAKRVDENKEKLVIAKMYMNGPDPTECPLLTGMNALEALRASYAYRRAPNFAWAMAFGALCRIKAAKQGAKAFTIEFAPVMTIPGAAVRIMSQDGLLVE